MGFYDLLFEVGAPLLQHGFQQQQFDEARGINEGLLYGSIIPSIFDQANSVGNYYGQVNPAILQSLYGTSAASADGYRQGAQQILGRGLPQIDPLQSLDLQSVIDAIDVPTNSAPGASNRENFRTNRGGRRREREGEITRTADNGREYTVRRQNQSNRSLRGQQQTDAGDFLQMRPDEMFQRVAAQAGITTDELAERSGMSQEAFRDLAANNPEAFDAVVGELETASREVANPSQDGGTIDPSGLNYMSRIDAGMGLLKGLGDQESRDISQAFRSGENRARQGLTDAGLYSGSVAASMPQGFAEQETDAQGRLQERVRQQFFNAYASLTGDALGAEERLLGNYANIANQGANNVINAAGSMADRNVNIYSDLNNQYRNAAQLGFVQGPAQPNFGSTFGAIGDRRLAGNVAEAQIAAANPSFGDQLLSGFSSGAAGALTGGLVNPLAAATGAGFGSLLGGGSYGSLYGQLLTGRR